MDDFGEHCRRLTEQFLQTAVVVDDEAFLGYPGMDNGNLRAPTRAGLNLDRGGSSGQRRGEHSLDAKEIIDSFAEMGVICGMVGPEGAAERVIRQADIVVLDWQLKDDDGQRTLDLLTHLLKEESSRNALRLVAVYTGESGLDDIQRTIVDRLGESGPYTPRVEPGVLSYGHGRVVLYAKHGVLVGRDWENRRVSEGELPSRLISDFSAMTIGLLPSIALASLTAVRESAHVVLDTFRADLDPAFLAHKACLANPDEAEQHMVASIASELRSVMDDAIASQEPAGRGPIEQWLGGQEQASRGFKFKGRTLQLGETVRLATDGLRATDNANYLEKNFECLSAGFGGENGEGLDERLAWIMASRTILDTPPPRLWLGTIVARSGKGADESEQLICLRPRCDSVRLDGRTSFGFLPLVEANKGKIQLVVRSSGAYRRREVRSDASGWKVYAFDPNREVRSVMAQNVAGEFAFKDACGVKYEWLGELKAEFAQRLARAFADDLSRPAVDDSEWLRRLAGK